MPEAPRPLPAAEIATRVRRVEAPKAAQVNAAEGKRAGGFWRGVVEKVGKANAFRKLAENNLRNRLHTAAAEAVKSPPTVPSREAQVVGTAEWAGHQEAKGKPIQVDRKAVAEVDKWKKDNGLVPESEQKDPEQVQREAIGQGWQRAHGELSNVQKAEKPKPSAKPEAGQAQTQEATAAATSPTEVAGAQPAVGVEQSTEGQVQTTAPTESPAEQSPETPAAAEQAQPVVVAEGPAEVPSEAAAKETNQSADMAVEKTKIYDDLADDPVVNTLKATIKDKIQSDPEYYALEPGGNYEEWVNNTARIEGRVGQADFDNFVYDYPEKAQAYAQQYPESELQKGIARKAEYERAFTELSNPTAEGKPAIPVDSIDNVDTWTDVIAAARGWDTNQHEANRAFIEGAVKHSKQLKRLEQQEKSAERTLSVVPPAPQEQRSDQQLAA